MAGLFLDSICWCGGAEVLVSQVLLQRSSDCSVLGV